MVLVSHPWSVHVKTIMDPQDDCGCSSCNEDAVKEEFCCAASCVRNGRRRKDGGNRWASVCIFYWDMNMYIWYIRAALSHIPCSPSHIMRTTHHVHVSASSESFECLLYPRFILHLYTIYTYLFLSIWFQLVNFSKDVAGRVGDTWYKGYICLKEVSNV